MSRSQDQWRPMAIDPGANNRIKMPRVMPQWMKNAELGRSGPLPPPPPADLPPPHTPGGNRRGFPPPSMSPAIEPDYEVIEFPTQQYMNANLNPSTSGNGLKKNDGTRCDLCGSSEPSVRCLNCSGQMFCMSCDEMYHRHPKRQTHLRKNLNISQENIRPPLPPKGVTSPPVPPPRRNKVSSSRHDNFGGTLNRRTASPSPVDNRTASLQRIATRPLPAVPTHQNNERPGILHKPPPVSQDLSANSSLQQRYKLHQQMMRGTPPDLSEDFTNMNIQSRQPAQTFRSQPKPEPNWQNNQWRAGSDQNLNQLDHENSNQQQFQSQMIHDHQQPMPMAPSPQRMMKRSNISASVFDLNSSGTVPPSQYPQQQRFNMMAQAQSMAQLGCMNCQHHMMGPPGTEWMQWGGHHGSNMSLNRTPEGFAQPPMWMGSGPWCGVPMFPNMLPPQHDGAHRNSLSRPQSRMNSRAASPTASVRSRRSRVSRRANIEREDNSDDEDDRRSSTRRSSIRNERRKQSHSGGDFSREIAVRSPSIEQDEKNIMVQGKPYYNTRRGSEESERQSVSQMSSSELQIPRMRAVAQKESMGTSPYTSDIDSDRRSITKEPIDEIVDKLDAPPPPTPQHSWICEYCTYVNEAGTRVCDVCCKTPTAPPRITSPPPKSDPLPKGQKVSSSESCAYDYSDAEGYTTKKKVQNHAPKATPETDSNDEAHIVTKKGESSSQYRVKGKRPQTPASDANQSIDEPRISSRISESNIVVRVKNVKRKPLAEKTSTGCGPSPPRDIEPPKRAVSVQNIKEQSPPLSPPPEMTKKVTMSTGTSPLPQSISTQTYDSIQNVKQEIQDKHNGSNDNENLQPKPESTRAEKLRKRFNRTLRRSNSLHNTKSTHDADHWSNIHKSERSMSRLSYSSDTHSIPTNSPRDESPARYGYDDFPEKEMKRLGHMGPLRSRSNSMLASSMGMGVPSSYRSIVDLRRPDLYREENIRSPYIDPFLFQNQRNDYIGYRRDSQPREISQTYGVDQLMQRRQSDVMKSQGMELVKLLREAELNNYSPEELQIAMTNCDSQNPIAWLKDNWSHMVETVLTVATNYGREGKENTVGTISHIEARDALKKHKGSVWQAVTECVEQRQKKFLEIQSRGKFSREDVLTCLTAHHGDMEAAFLELSKTQLKPFLMRIWGPPSGVDNESGNSGVMLGSQGTSHHNEYRREDAGLSGPNTLLDYIKTHADQATLAKEASVTAARSVSPPNRALPQEQSIQKAEPASSSKVSTNDSTPGQAVSSPSLDLLNNLRELIQQVENSQTTNSVLKDIGNLMSKLEKGNINETITETNLNTVQNNHPSAELNTNTPKSENQIPPKQEKNTKLKIHKGNEEKTKKNTSTKSKKTKVNTNLNKSNKFTSSNESMSKTKKNKKQINNESANPSPHERDPKGQNSNTLQEKIKSSPKAVIEIKSQTVNEIQTESSDETESESENKDLPSDQREKQVRLSKIENEYVKVNMQIENHSVKPILPDNLDITTSEPKVVSHLSQEINSQESSDELEEQQINSLQSTASQDNIEFFDTIESIEEDEPNIDDPNTNNFNSPSSSTSNRNSPILTENNSQKVGTTIVEENIDNDRKTQPLFNIMEDTQKLIQQMRDEIKSDIATYINTSEDDSSDEDDESERQSDEGTTDSSAMPASSAQEPDSEDEQTFSQSQSERESSESDISGDDEDIKEEIFNKNDKTKNIVENTIFEDNASAEYTSDENDKFEEAHSAESSNESENYLSDDEHEMTSVNEISRMESANGLEVFDTLAKDLQNQVHNISDTRRLIQSEESGINDILNDETGETILANVGQPLHASTEISTFQNNITLHSTDGNSEIVINCEENGVEKIDNNNEKNSQSVINQTIVTSENNVILLSNEILNIQQVPLLDDSEILTNISNNNPPGENILKVETDSKNENIIASEKYQSNDIDNNERSTIINHSQMEEDTIKENILVSGVSKTSTAHNIINEDIINNGLDEHENISRQLKDEIPTTSSNENNIIDKNENDVNNSDSISLNTRTITNDLKEIEDTLPSSSFNTQTSINNEETKVSHNPSDSLSLVNFIDDDDEEISADEEVQLSLIINKQSHHEPSEITTSAIITNNPSLIENNQPSEINIETDTTLLLQENNPEPKKLNINTKKSQKMFISQIPKLDKQTNNKTSTKVNPKNSATKKEDPTQEKPLPFGNFQNGHVKKLQQGLFNKVNVTIANLSEKKMPKIPVPISPKRLSDVKNNPIPEIKIETSKNSSGESSSSQKKADTSKDSGKQGKLKPYFLETCLSDDYFTETDEEVHKPPKKLVIKKPTVIENKNLNITLELSDTDDDDHLVLNKKRIDISSINLKEDSPERQIRMLMAEGIVPSWEQAEVALGLVQMKFDKASALLAANECTTLEAALSYLQQECELCTGKYPMKEMVSMLKCTHRCCKECAKNYFTIQITDRSIFDCVCPFCKIPELHDQDEDEVLEYFSNLDILLKCILEENVHELFQRKLRDRTLMQDPNFKWCVECSSGFIANPRQRRLVCPDCRSITCALCRRPWEAQHDGITCEKFAEWKELNDPDSQVAGVNKHLDDHGIDCPKCKFRYALSRGGCMHFTCSQCKYEFCSGCGKPFMMGAKCGLSPYCARLGLHSHHPRNCLFYLRDKEPRQLQTLLALNNIEFKTIGPETTGEGNSARCPIQLQRETPAGLVDTVCNSDIVKDHAGLCKIHYLEYLVELIGTVDPLPIMDLSDMVAELRRRAIPLPERGPWDTDPIYTDMCAQIIKEKIPMD